MQIFSRQRQKLLKIRFALPPLDSDSSKGSFEQTSMVSLGGILVKGEPTSIKKKEIKFFYSKYLQQNENNLLRRIYKFPKVLKLALLSL